MNLITYGKARLRRQIGLQSLGPNEARMLYDAAAGTFGAAVTAVFSTIYIDGMKTAPRIAALCSVPVLLLAFNAAFGVYSRLRIAPGKTKAAVLTTTTLLSGAAAWLFGAPLPGVALWMFLVCPPLVLARLLLDLPYGRHKRLITIAVNHRGPVLVLGGGGYIGTHTVDLLLRKGRQVRVLDRLMYGREPLAHFLGNPNFELIEGDATDISKLTLAMKDASAVVHLAGLVGDPACAVDTTFTRHVNIVATRMAKEVAQSMGIHRFVFASSCSVYGCSDAEVSESHALNPVSLYAQTKIDSEKELLSTVRDDFFVTVLRFATVFGHSQRPRFDLVANLFTAQAMTDGLITVVGPNQWRPFIHVRDLARAIGLVLDSDPLVVQSQIFNTGDQRLNMTIGQLAETVRTTCSRYRTVTISTRENAQDRRNYAVSFEKIRSVLGFQAATPMEDGIMEMAEAFQQGLYRHYGEQVYSNLSTTARAVNEFYDPAVSSHLYGPLQVVPDAQGRS
jgi:nucleoside-diphosphate-sugar epimerase